MWFHGHDLSRSRSKNITEFSEFHILATTCPTDIYQNLAKMQKSRVSAFMLNSTRVMGQKSGICWVNTKNSQLWIWYPCKLVTPTRSACSNYSLFTLRKLSCPVILSGERGFLRVNRLYNWVGWLVLVNAKRVPYIKPRVKSSYVATRVTLSVSLRSGTPSTDTNFQCLFHLLHCFRRVWNLK